METESISVGAARHLQCRFQDSGGEEEEGVIAHRVRSISRVMKMSWNEVVEGARRGGCASQKQGRGHLECLSFTGSKGPTTCALCQPQWPGQPTTYGLTQEEEGVEVGKPRRASPLGMGLLRLLSGQWGLGHAMDADPGFQEGEQ